MFGIGMPELIIILIIILIIFGAGKLPEIGSGIGKGIKNFKKATHEAKTDEIAPPKETHETHPGTTGNEPGRAPTPSLLPIRERALTRADGKNQLK